MALLAQGITLENRYEILGVLGEGGMGAVYRVADLRLNRRPWALKQVPLGGPGQDAVALKQEADLLATLEYEHLPRVVDYFEEGGAGYLVMELVEGETLDRKVRDKGPLSVEATVKLAAQLCDTLEYLHGHKPPIIFRDLKPANIMIAPGGKIKLIDFGIARLFTGGQSHDTVALGTPGYAAPEQYGKAQSDVRTDVYGLGATLYFAVSGLDPADQAFPLKPLKSLFKTLPESISDTVERCTAIDAKARFDSVAAVRQALQAPVPLTPPVPAPAAVAQAPVTALLPGRRKWFKRGPKTPAPPLQVGTSRIDFGPITRQSTQSVPLQIQGPKVKVKSDIPWVRVKRRRGLWFAEVKARAVPAGGVHQGTIRIDGGGTTHNLPVRVNLKTETASGFLKIGMFVLMLLSLVPVAGLVFYLILLFTHITNNRDVRQQLSGYVRTASLIAAANAVLSGLAWGFFHEIVAHW